MANSLRSAGGEDGFAASGNPGHSAGCTEAGFASRPPAASVPEEVAGMLTVERVEFGAGRMTLLVRMAPGGQLTTPQLLQRLLPRYPDLPHHACVNDEGPTFRAVMDHTSLAHLLEHLIISQQLRLLPAAVAPAPVSAAAAAAFPSASARLAPLGAADPVLCGATTWVSQAEGRARIEMSFADDLIALEALHNALADLSASIPE